MLPDDRVVVPGHAAREIQPDRAEWRVQVQERAADPRSCFEACAARQSALVGRLRELAELRSLTTGTIRLHREAEYERRSPGYVASAELWVGADPIAGGAVLAALGEVGVDELRGPRLEASGAQAAANDLRAEAVADARDRAERLAVAAGRKLGRAMAIRERSEYYDPDDDEEVFAVSAKMAAGPQFEAAPRALTVVARVQVSFELT